jgi:hypothetical protein
MKHLNEFKLNEHFTSDKMDFMELQNNTLFKEEILPLIIDNNSESWRLFQDQRFMTDFMKGGLLFEVTDNNEVHVYLENRNDRILFESKGNAIQIILKFIGYSLGCDEVTLRRNDQGEYYIRWWWD